MNLDETTVNDEETERELLEIFYHERVFLQFKNYEHIEKIFN